MSSKTKTVPVWENVPTTKANLRGYARTSEGPYKYKTSITWENVPNKPLLLSYLFWYFQHTAEYPTRDTGRSVQVHLLLKTLGLVNISTSSDGEDDEEWLITEKGNALVQYILDVPLPEQKITWVMPGAED